jgi:hypothetical protein
MNIQSATIEIKGKEYTFLKPTAASLIDIEDMCYAGGKFSNQTYIDKMLGIVSPDLKAEDFVVSNFEPYKLSSGEVITPKEVSRDDVAQKIDELSANGGKRTDFAKEFLKLCGATDPDLSGLTYDDINGLANNYLTLFDETELSEVVDRIYTFCF